MSGTLIGISVGPGDPELLTVKAARLLGTAKVIGYIALPETPSFARKIAASYLAENIREIRIDIPMSVDPMPAQMAYDHGAEAIAKVLKSGTDVLCLCEGDALFYGSFSHLALRLGADFPVSVVPGVTSIAAASALAVQPLSIRNEVVTVLPAPLSDEALILRLAQCDVAVLLKLGRHVARIRALATRLGLDGYYAAHVSLPDSSLLKLSQAPDDAPYFSLAILRRTKANG